MSKSTVIAASLMVLALSPAMAREEKSIHKYSEQVTRTVEPVFIEKKTQAEKPAQQKFVELVNEARLEIVKKQPQNAKPKIAEAKKLVEFMRANSSVQETYKETHFTSGRVTYNQETTTGSYYVPFETGPIKLKSVGSTEQGKGSVDPAAITSADVVYLTVDLAGKDAEGFLSQAEIALKQGDLRSADKALENLLAAVTKMDVKEAMPFEKTRDNLALALSFLEVENYSGARYALSNAVEALKAMQSDSRYDAGAASELQGDVQQIHDLIMAQDSSRAQKARTQIKEAQGDLSKLQK